MMNYEIFKEVVAEKFMDYMPSQYKDMKLEIHPVEKVNVTLDGMNLAYSELVRRTVLIEATKVLGENKKENE